MAGGDSLVARPRGCRPRSGGCRRKPGRRRSVYVLARPIGAMDRFGAAARHTGAVVTRPPSGSIPDAPGSYQFVDRDGRPLYVGKAKSLRQRLNSYFQDPAGLAPRTAQMVQPGRPRGVDGGGLRGRGPPPRAQPHQAVPAPVQRAAEGRQELSVAGHHRQRRVAPAGRGAGPQAQRGALLRPLSQRRGHPGDPRPAAAVLSRPDLLGHQIPAPSAPGAALPAVPHRPVLGPVRGGHRPRRVRAPGGRPDLLSQRRHRSAGAQHRDRDGARRPRRWSSNGPRSSGTSSTP